MQQKLSLTAVAIIDNIYGTKKNECINGQIKFYLSLIYMKLSKLCKRWVFELTAPKKEHIENFGHHIKYVSLISHTP